VKNSRSSRRAGSSARHLSRAALKLSTCSSTAPAVRPAQDAERDARQANRGEGRHHERRQPARARSVQMAARSRVQSGHADRRKTCGRRLARIRVLPFRPGVGRRSARPAAPPAVVHPGRRSARDDAARRVRGQRRDRVEARLPPPLPVPRGPARAERRLPRPDPRGDPGLRDGVVGDLAVPRGSAGRLRARLRGTGRGGAARPDVHLLRAAERERRGGGRPGGARRRRRRLPAPLPRRLPLLPRAARLPPRLRPPRPDFWATSSRRRSAAARPGDVPAAVRVANPWTAATSRTRSRASALHGRDGAAVCAERPRGLHASGWATLSDCITNRSASLDVAAKGAETGAFLAAAGAAGRPSWWTSPIATRAGARRRGRTRGSTRATRCSPPSRRRSGGPAVSDTVGRPLIWWQIPVGDMDLPDQPVRVEG
jgi:hypothetical protein